MNSDSELNEIESIEDSLDEDINCITKISETYANFLLDLLLSGRFSKLIADNDLQKIRACLEDATHLISTGKEAQCLQNLRTVEKNARDSNPALSHLARCVIQSYIREKDWDDETAPDRSPLYLFLLGIRKIIPDIGPEFVSYFKAKL